MKELRAIGGAVVFLAAFLLFVVEPMAAKQLLPALGGSSAVWVTCLVFFQAMLLAGYAYAHWMAEQRRPRMHLAALGAALVALAIPPARGIALGAGQGRFGVSWQPSMHPIGTIFAVLTPTIGLPFLALAATTPLVQVWWTRMTGRPVPYRMFALSNAGSLGALLAYPVLIEPRLTLTMQRRLWGWGFVVFVLLCGWLTIQADRAAAAARNAVGQEDAADASKAPVNAAAGPDRPSRLQRWLWFLLPMAATIQLAAVTNHLSQDLASIPLLWILPLATYLLTFIFAFEMPGLYRRWIVVRLLVVFLASLAYALSTLDTRLPLGMSILFYLVELFLACWFCHAEAYRLRPASARQSTAFYLLVAAGGVTGTFFVAIACPIIFRANYDLAISFLVTAVLAAIVTWEQGWQQRLLWVTASGLMLGLIVALNIQFARNSLMRARNFYGSLRVVQTDFDDADVKEAGPGPVRTLMNGRIRHGMQVLNAELRDTPTTYYGTDSGVAVAMRNCCGRQAKKVGVIGLGAGTMAAYGQPGDVFRFYEINPLVEPIARNLFTYLRDSKAAISVEHGDGRALLANESPQDYDVLVVDAFSGDAIPVHLLTREAMQVYRRQLAPDGVIAFHVSNSYLDLAPEVALLAKSAGMEARVVENEPVLSEGEFRSTWVLVSADAAFFAQPGVDAVAHRIDPQPGLRLWTDDYSSLLPMLRLGN
ncbi:MAG TPA: fused MFS/spermidine synthase [Acidobacteriaceae bacterium]|nr:fused MFS/spermidine synthase [Acidobacteriaceae bacterium]